MNFHVGVNCCFDTEQFFISLHEIMLHYKRSQAALASSTALQMVGHGVRRDFCEPGGKNNAASAH